MALRDDPYRSLEDVDSEESMDFVQLANKYCLKALGDPTKSKTDSYSKILKVLESDERIPFVSKMGKDDSGSDLLYNLWKDSKVREHFTNIMQLPIFTSIALTFIILFTEQERIMA